MTEWLFTKFADSPIQEGVESLPSAEANQASLDTVLTFVFGLAGAIALLFLIIGGMRFILSRGDPNGTTQAIRTILNSIIGLVIVIIAFAIVRFVITNV